MVKREGGRRIGACRTQGTDINKNGGTSRDVPPVEFFFVIIPMKTFNIQIFKHFPRISEKMLFG